MVCPFMPVNSSKVADQQTEAQTFRVAQPWLWSGEPNPGCLAVDTMIQAFLHGAPPVGCQVRVIGVMRRLCPGLGVGIGCTIAHGAPIFPGNRSQRVFWVGSLFPAPDVAPGLRPPRVPECWLRRSGREGQVI